MAKRRRSKRSAVALNPQPLPPKIAKKRRKRRGTRALNPQPIPPGKRRRRRKTVRRTARRKR
jgi:hypothetical protein